MIYVTYYFKIVLLMTRNDYNRIQKNLIRTEDNHLKKILASIVVILLVAALSFSIYAAMTHESKSSNTDSNKDNQN